MSALCSQALAPHAAFRLKANNNGHCYSRHDLRGWMGMLPVGDGLWDLRSSFAALVTPSCAFYLIATTRGHDVLVHLLGKPQHVDAHPCRRGVAALVQRSAR